MDKLNKVNKGIKIYEKNRKLYKNHPNIEDQINNSKKFPKGLEKIIVGIDKNNFRIGRDFITETGSIDLSWMHDPVLYEEISQDVFSRCNKDKYSNELESIQTFLDNINEEYIKNKKDALEEFKTVKNNVKSENLRDYIKDLKLAIFGHDDDEELEYEESIAERTKMRRQNKETDNCLLMMKRLKKKKNRNKKYMRKSMMVLGMMMLGITSGGLIKMDIIEMGMTGGGLIKIGLRKMGMTGGALIKMALIKMGMMNMGLIKMGSIKMEKKTKNIINGDVT